MFICGLMWIKDSVHGIVERSRVHNITKTHILTAHFAVMSLIGATSALLLMLTVVPIFDIPYDSTMINVALLLIIQTTSSISLGFFLALTSHAEFDYIMKVCIVFFPTPFVSEIYWPLDNRNYLTHAVSSLYPLKATTVALRALFYEKLHFTDHLVHIGFVYNIFYLILMLTFCFAWIKIKK